jgi:putative copper resistance protein D
VLQFLNLFGFVSVILRAATLALGSVAVGGVLFRWIVAREEALDSRLRLLMLSAFGLAATQLFYLLTNSMLLSATSGLSVMELSGASYFVWGCASALAAFTIGAMAMGRSPQSVLEVACSSVIVCATVGTSHAAARLDHRVILTAATLVHQASAAAWIGGLPYLLLTLRRCSNVSEAAAICKRFSTLALLSVTFLLASGLVVAKLYIGDLSGVYGTTYGVMVVAKGVLFALILSLGAMNFRLIRNRSEGNGSWLAYLKRISEAEIGIGITVILAAASLTSQPPAIDLKKDRATLAVIAERMFPKPPKMSTPALSTLSPSTRAIWKREARSQPTNSQAYVPGETPYVPPTQGDIAWSEYNHHWAGLTVAFMGVLAVFARYRRFAFARHWPLAFIGLAVFLLLRADPENWPLGPNGFWESFTSADVTQHRFFVVLILLFAAFEWAVQTGRLTSKRAALVFPASCCLGGALLLTHTHAVSNIREELLAELSHIPLALLAVVAGWARWLELRLPQGAPRIAARIWPVSLVLIGVVLLLYREA